MMNKTLVAVADLGRVKVFARVKGEDDRQAHLELLEAQRQTAGRAKLSAQLTDNAGRFPRAHGPAVVGNTGMSIGDRHNVALEQQRRAVRAIADELTGWLDGGEFESCWLAATPAVRQPLLDALRADIRSKIVRTLSLDLTKSNPDEVLRHFEAVK